MPRVPTEFLEAYKEYDREITIKKTRIGCVIGIVLVPLFTVLDYTLYPVYAGEFLRIRLLCSLLIAALYPVLGTNLGRKYYRLQGVILLFLPTATIGYMLTTDP